MRRVLLLAFLLAGLAAAPAAAHAQATPSAGQVTFDNAFIGAEACTSTAGGNAARQVHLNWQDQLDTGATATAGVFRVYATNWAPPVTGSRYCQTTNNPANTGGPIYAGQVGADLPNTGIQLTGTAYELTAEIAQRAGGCNLTNGAPVYVCVHFYPYASGTTTPQSTPTAWAVGQMTLSLTTPGAVHLDGLLPGNGALSASWTDANSPAAAKYKVVALSLADPTLALTPGAFVSPAAFTGFNAQDPTPHDSGFVTGTGPYAVRGLVNGLTYGVAVVAYTDAETASEPSNVLTGMPQLTSGFWETYKADGGRETGGCSSGAAGPVGLLVLAGALSLARRRK